MKKATGFIAAIVLAVSLTVPAYAQERPRSKTLKEEMERRYADWGNACLTLTRLIGENKLEFTKHFFELGCIELIKFIREDHMR